MSDQQLGQLTEVDIQSVWPHESQDFTPWLAEHLLLLGDAVRLRLELVGTEQSVGAFSADIVAEGDLGRVVIENQYGRTDHDHLGKLLTYAGGQDARVLIWVTQEVRDEHRAAIDWLNRFTVDEVEVYAVEVRAVQIGDSLRAPEFRAVAFPNNWSRQSQRIASKPSGVSFTPDQYRAFFQPVVDALRIDGLTEQAKAYGSYSQRFPSAANIEKADYMVSMTAPSSGHFANVYLYLGSDDRELNLRVYEALEEQRAAIEDELGEILIWQPSRGYRTSISLSRPASISDPPAVQKEIQEWVIQKLPQLKEVLEPRLLAIAKDSQTEQPDAVED